MRHLLKLAATLALILPAVAGCSRTTPPPAPPSQPASSTQPAAVTALPPLLTPTLAWKVTVTNAAEGAIEGDFRPIMLDIVLENTSNAFVFGRDEENGRFGTTTLDPTGQPSGFAPFAVQLGDAPQTYANWLYRKALDPNRPREVVIPPGFRLAGVARVDFPAHSTPTKLTIRAGEPPVEAELVSYAYAEVSRPPAQSPASPELPGGPADTPALPATVTAGQATLTVTGVNRLDSLEGATCTPPTGHRLVVLDVTVKNGGTSAGVSGDVLSTLLLFDRDLNLYRTVSSVTGDLKAEGTPGAQCSGRPSQAIALDQIGAGQEAQGVLAYIVRQDSAQLWLAALDGPAQVLGKVYKLP
jgi:hypothetical protein